MKFDFEKITQAAALGVAVTASLTSMSQAAVVINEVYTAGGSTAAPIKFDFVELYNNGESAVSLSGLFLQYASSAGNFVGAPTGTNALSSQNFSFATDAVIAASGYYLVAGSGGSLTGTGSVVAVDGTSGLSLSGTAGKLRLTTSLVADAGSSAPSSIDFIGYGVGTSLPNAFEGLAPAVAAATTAGFSYNRTLTGGDTNNNGADFSYLAFSPTAAVPEPAALGILAVGAGLALKRRNKK
jgi:hypothetical protein